MTTKLQLTPEEIRTAIKKAHEQKPGVLLPVGDIYDSIAEAQVDKVLEKIEEKFMLKPDCWTRELHKEGTVIIHSISWQALKEGK